MLIPGIYKIKVVRNGYHTKRAEVDLYSDLDIRIVLQKKEKKRVAQVAAPAVSNIPKQKDTTSTKLNSKVKKVDKSDIFLDFLTSLMWQDNHDVIQNKKNWSDAKAYCSNFSLYGYYDWRLPTIDELKTIIDKNRSSHVTDEINNMVLLDVSLFWSSTTDIFSLNNAQVLYFKNGNSLEEEKLDEYYVRCVRKNSENILYKRKKSKSE